ncbi:MAG: hypothetical protein KDD37_04735, partial [Bdellovibrionales bacterium]|nr:hypothetical protein [Bdellovibrionales bacterium]
FSDVKQIVDPAVAQDQSKKFHDITNMDLQRTEAVDETKGRQAKGNLDHVPMARELSNKIKEK